MEVNEHEGDSDYVIVDGQKVDAVFWKYLNETKSISKTLDLVHEWNMAHGGCKGLICTNDYHEAELERDTLVERIKEYGLDMDDFKETIEEYDRWVAKLKRREEGRATVEDELEDEAERVNLGIFAADLDDEGLDYDDPYVLKKIEARMAAKKKGLRKNGKA